MSPMLDLFGDESAVNSAVIYGLVVLPCDRTLLAENALNSVKRRFGGNEVDRLHCRELFYGERRKSTAWAHLSLPDVFRLCWESADSVSSVGASFRVGFIDRRKLPEHFFWAGQHPQSPAGPKQLVSFAYATVLAGFEQDPGVSGVRLWADPDNTKIPWGGRRRKASNVPLTFDVSGESKAIKPEVIQGSKPLLLDVADILAYSSAQSLSAEARSDKESFREIFARFSAEVREFSFHEQAFSKPGGLG